MLNNFFIIFLILISFSKFAFSNEPTDIWSLEKKEKSGEEIITIDSSSSEIENKKIKINDFSATVIALYTGMRIEEICLIKGKDIEGKCIKILKGKTKASSRTIPISGSIQPIMNRLYS